MVRLTRWTHRVLCTLAAAAAIAASASERELTLNIGGRMTTHAPASLLGMPTASSIDLPRDAAYGTATTYRAVPITSLLAGVAPEESVRFVSANGRDIVLPASLLLGRTGSAVAYLAVEPADAPWPALGHNDAHSAGPFYLVWTNPERSGIAPVLWREQVVHIETLGSVAKRFPAWLPAGGVAPRDAVRRGFTGYVRQCSACHTLNLAGDASLGPDLNFPSNPTEYLRVDALRHFIRDPQSLRRWPGEQMPAMGPNALSDRELTDLMAYLRHMADRKVASPMVKR
jgi:mono/diheme cytochrome c family protein